MISKHTLIFALVFLILTTAALADTEISSCMELDIVGENYTLTQDLLGSYDGSTCVEITADDITLDCNDYSIISEEDSSLFLNGVEGTMIQSCTVSGANIEIIDSDNNFFEGSSFGGEVSFSIDEDSDNNEFYNNYFLEQLEIFVFGSSNAFYNNYFYNSENFQLGSNALGTTSLSLSSTIESVNIIGGTWVGGNYWADLYETGFSETCEDIDGNGFCDTIYDASGSSDLDEFALTDNFDSEVSSCGELGAEGKTYTLTQDIGEGASGTSCVEITADTVTLDCNGFSISNVDETEVGFGILSSAEYSVVESCSLDGWTTGVGFTTGADYSAVHGSNFSNLSSSGIYLGSNENIIESNTFSGEDFIGVGLELSNDNFIYNNYFNLETPVSFNMASAVFSIAKTLGENIIGGEYLGGNFWSNPSSDGYSQTCLDNDGDDFCDVEYDVTSFGDFDSLPLTNTFTTEVDNCRLLENEGETYSLSQDIVADQDRCIEITANNVTLEGNGFTISGEDGYKEAVYLFEVNNTLLRDFTLTEFVDTDDTVSEYPECVDADLDGFCDEDRVNAVIYSEGTEGLILNEMNIQNNTGIGLVLLGSDSFSVMNSIFNLNYGGIYFLDSESGLISSVEFLDSSEYGIWHVSGSSDSLTIEGLTMSDNVEGAISYSGDYAAWNIDGNETFTDNNLTIGTSETNTNLAFGEDGILSLVNSYLILDGLEITNQGDIISLQAITQEVSLDSYESYVVYDEITGEIISVDLESYVTTHCSGYEGDFATVICPLSNSEYTYDDQGVNVTVSWENVTLGDFTDAPEETLVVSGEIPGDTTSITDYTFLKAFDFDIQGDENVVFDSSVITINYTDNELSELNLEESGLNLYYYNEETLAWEDIENQTLSTDENFIEATLEHFSLYGLFGTEIVSDSGSDSSSGSGSSSSSSSSSGGGGGGSSSSSSSSSSDDESEEDTTTDVDETLEDTEEEEEEEVEEETETVIEEEIVEDSTAEEDEEEEEESSSGNFLTGAITGIFDASFKEIILPAAIILALGLICSLLIVGRKKFFNK